MTTWLGWEMEHKFAHLNQLQLNSRGEEEQGGREAKERESAETTKLCSSVCP